MTATTGAAVRSARIAARLSVAELAAAAHCLPATVELIEVGTVLPTLRLLQTLASGCGVAVESLYDADDLNDPVIRFDREMAAMVDAAPMLTETQRAILRPLLRLVSGRDGAA